MSSTPVPDSPQFSAPPPVVVVCDSPLAERQARRLLGGAGFAVAYAALGELGHRSDELTVMLLGSPAATRLAAIEAAAAQRPDVPLLATMPGDAGGALLRRALQRGADGIVLDGEVATALVPSAKALLAGQLTVPRSLRRQLAPQALSHREKEILALVVIGHTNAQIAAALFVAECTVKSHLSSVFVKLDVGSRAEAAAVVSDPEAGYRLPPAAV